MSVLCCIRTASTSTPVTTTPLMTTTTASPCPEGWTLFVNVEGNSDCYITLDGPSESPNAGFLQGCLQASASCQALGGQLVSIHSASDNTYFYLNLAQPGVFNPAFSTAISQGTCIGLTSAVGPSNEATTGWKWFDGTPYDFQQWFNVPNDLGVQCIFMYTASTNGGLLTLWDDTPCTTAMRNAICEKPANV